MRRFSYGAEDFAAGIERLSLSGEDAFSRVEGDVRAIIERVRDEGDDALVELTQAFDGVSLDAGNLVVGEEEIARALDALPAETLDALKLAEERIRAFHEAQVPQAITTGQTPGERLTLEPTPLASVGLYAPGGTAAYPSTVLMNATPARVAGVDELVLCTPPGPNGEVPAAVLAAASLAGLKRVVRVGGAIERTVHLPEDLERNGGACDDAWFLRDHRRAAVEVIREEAGRCIGGGLVLGERVLDELNGAVPAVELHRIALR